MTSGTETAPRRLSRDSSRPDLPPSRPALLPPNGWARLALVLLLCFTFFRGVLWADVMPLFYGPDEDYHFLYAIVLVVLAATGSGNTWGLGRMWARLPFVQRHRWAL